MAPRDIPGGVDYGGAITEALRDSRAMVLLLSEESNVSPQVLRELKIAAGNGLPIVAVRLETLTLSPSMTYYLGGYQWIDAVNVTTDVYMQRLTSDVGAIVRRRATAPVGELNFTESVRPASSSREDEPRADQRGSEAWDAESFMANVQDLFRQGVPLGQYPDFKLPPGWYYGPRSGRERSVSGYTNVEHRRALFLFQVALGLSEQEGEADGLYGPATRSAVNAFQEKHGLTADGLIGPETWQAVWQATCYPFEVG